MEKGSSKYENSIERERAFFGIASYAVYLDVRRFVPFTTLYNFSKIELFVTCGEESQILELSLGEVIDLLMAIIALWYECLFYST